MVGRASSRAANVGPRLFATTRHSVGDHRLRAAERRPAGNLKKKSPSQKRETRARQFGRYNDLGEGELPSRVAANSPSVIKLAGEEVVINFLMLALKSS